MEAASMIGSQVLANWAFSHGSKNNFASPSILSVLLAMVNIAFTIKICTESQSKAKLIEHRTTFFVYIFSDKRMWLLGCAQACLHFSVVVFWILWAPTLVADGREVQLGLIYPCLLGSRMLGSTTFPWSLSVLLSLRIEDCLLYEFIGAGVVVSVIAYDYQEIGVFIALFCLFQAAVGLILPTLARLRSMVASIRTSIIQLYLSLLHWDSSCRPVACICLSIWANSLIRTGINDDPAIFASKEAHVF